ncbi:right-handed parallel beta-helix repeat-containing protein [Planctomycetota bacterium]
MTDAVVTNNVIVGNKTYAFYGGGVFCRRVSALLVSNTICDNATRTGGGIYVAGSTGGPYPATDVTLVNCILWGNEASDQIALVSSPATLTVSHCDVQGGQAAAYVWGTGTLNWGSGNIDADPLLVSPGLIEDQGTVQWWDDVWTDGDYHLLERSPCTDVGFWGTGVPENDIEGNPRYDDLGMPNGPDAGTPPKDMGAYERQSDSLPVIVEILPTSGPPGSQVWLWGSGFERDQGTGHVDVGGTPAEIVQWGANAINLRVPPALLTGVVQVVAVTDRGATSNAVTFTVTAPPTTAHADDDNATGIEDGSERYPFDTIQEAVDAVADGGTVKVAAGDYPEGVEVLSRTLHLLGGYPGGTDYDSGPGVFGDAQRDWATHEARILGSQEPGQERRCVKFDSADGEISGFNIIWGAAAGTGHDAAGGGIYCSYSPVLIQDNATGVNYAGLGGGIYCYHSSATIRDNAIGDNVGGSGAGVYCEGASPVITGNTITDNGYILSGDGKGTGICCVMSSPQIIDNTVERNQTGYEGGGIYCEQSSPTITGNEIRDNSVVDRGGGICCKDCTFVSITDNAIEGNWEESPINPGMASSPADGGGIYLFGCGSASVSDNTLSGNHCAVAGGGIYVGSCDQASITGNTIENGGAFSGGGLHCANSQSPTISDNVIQGNAAYFGSGVRLSSCADASLVGNTIRGGWGLGGDASSSLNSSGILCEGSAGVLIAGNTITENHAEQGGGIDLVGSHSSVIEANVIQLNTCSEGGATSLSQGGGIRVASDSVSVRDNSIDANSSGQGGGIYCAGASVEIVRNSISGNHASVSTIGDAIGAGGGIYCTGVSPVIAQNAIVRNWARGVDSDETTGVGGGIYCDATSSPATTNNTIVSNVAEREVDAETFIPASGGGVHCEAGAQPTIRNCILWDNGDDLDGCSATYSCIEDGDPGTGNTALDPLFADPAGGDYHLDDYSPCTDTAFWGTGVLENDIEGNPRYDDLGMPNGPDAGTPPRDMGAYERQSDSLPVIDEIFPTSGPPGSQVWLWGSGFERDQGTGHVDVGGTPAEIVQWGANAINLRVSLGLSPGVVQVVAVTDRGATSNAVTFTVTAPPTTARADDDNATGIEDGTERYPFSTIQEAVSAVADGGTVKVAQGIYTETVQISGRMIYLRGGYIGGTDYAVGAGDFADAGRDWEAQVTTIDGEQQRRCVEFDNADGEVSGFAIVAGADMVAFGPGGGLYCRLSSILITHNVIAGNFGVGDGGGIYGVGSSLVISYNTISSNLAAHGGGGIGCLDCPSLVIAQNTVEHNGESLSGPEYGGGIHVEGCDGASIGNNAVRSNVASMGGGGVSCSDSVGVTISGNTIAENLASGWGGGGIYLPNGETSITSNTILGNEATIESESYGGGILCAPLGECTVVGNVIAGNQSCGGGGICTWGVMTVRNNTISGNDGGNGGGIACLGGSADIWNNTITGNNPAHGGGGMGGAVYVAGASGPASAQATVTGCILWDNLCNEGHEMAVEGCWGGPASLSVAFSDVQGGQSEVYVDPEDPDATLVWGEGNIDVDPRFVDPANGDYHLQNGSPCINAGDNSEVEAGETDMDGEARIQQLVVDMGADETDSVGAPNSPGPAEFETDTYVNGRLNPDGPAPKSGLLESIDPNGNPAETLYAIQWGTDPNDGWLYFVADGARTDVFADGTAPEWHAADEWLSKRVRKLQPSTTYTFRATCKTPPGAPAALHGGLGGQTPLIDVGTFTTNRDCDVNDNGFTTAFDYAYIKAAILRGDVSGDLLVWPCDVDDSGAIDVIDLSLTQGVALDPQLLP